MRQCDIIIPGKRRSKEVIEGEDSESGIVDIHADVRLDKVRAKQFKACKAACDKRVW